MMKITYVGANHLYLGGTVLIFSYCTYFFDFVPIFLNSLMSKIVLLIFVSKFGNLTIFYLLA